MTARHPVNLARNCAVEAGVKEASRKEVLTMLGAGIPPVLPSAGPSSGNGLALVAVTIVLLVVAAALFIHWARGTKAYGRTPEHEVEQTYDRAA